MAIVSLHPRQFLRLLANADVTVAKHYPSVTTTQVSRYSAAVEMTEEPKPRNEKRGEWFTLPPFESTIDGSALGREISGRRKDLVSSGAGGEDDGAMTAIKWILRCCPNLPRSLVQKLFRLRQVRRETSVSCDLGNTVQGEERRLKRVASKDSMNLGDQIFLPISVQEIPSEKKVIPFSMKEQKFIRSLELYKDPDIIVVNKPHGMPVQGGIGIKRSLDELAATYLKYDFPDPPRLVHRLDRDSSGILVLGRTQLSTTVLHSIFREKTFGASNKESDEHKRKLQRKYWALVIGTPKRSRGIISVPLGKVVVDNGKSERITLINDVENLSSQHAVTEYRVIKPSCHGFTWLELSPLTGRKHQLRVHCAEVLRTPIVGDYKYGWQAHKQLPPINSENFSFEKLPKVKTPPFSFVSQDGSISEKEPSLHLHCKHMVLPNVSQALKNIRAASDCDTENLDKLEFVAPLPVHMQRSWDILNS